MWIKVKCKPDIINGWIIKFIPYDNNNKKNDFKSPHFNGLNIDQLPTQIVNLPFSLINLNKRGNRNNYDAEIYSGFFGVKQDRETLSIKPIIGYAIVEVKDKKKVEQKKREEEIKINLSVREIERKMNSKNFFLYEN